MALFTQLSTTIRSIFHLLHSYSPLWYTCWATLPLKGVSMYTVSNRRLLYHEVVEHLDNQEQLEAYLIQHTWEHRQFLDCREGTEGGEIVRATYKVKVGKNGSRKRVSITISSISGNESAKWAADY